MLYILSQSSSAIGIAKEEKKIEMQDQNAQSGHEQVITSDLAVMSFKSVRSYLAGTYGSAAFSGDEP